MNNIKSFYEFIFELRKITTSVSGSGKTSEVEWIHDDPESPKSTSAGILLRQQLRDEEYKDLLDRLRDDKFDKSSLKKASKEEKLAVTLNNLKFLKDMELERGQLKCEYCGKGPLKVYDFDMEGFDPKNIGKQKWRFNNNFSKENGATCDHKQPQSKGGDKYDYSNLAVCCWDCNNDKEDMSWERWKQYKKIKESMKYLKRFNESISDFFSEISDNEFFDKTNQSGKNQKLDFNNKEIDLVISYFLDLEESLDYTVSSLSDEIKIKKDDSKVFVFFEDSVIKMMFDYKRAYIHFNLYKTDDEWYYVRSTSSRDGYKNYKCDQIDGLKAFLDDKIAMEVKFFKVGGRLGHQR